MATPGKRGAKRKVQTMDFKYQAILEVEKGRQLTAVAKELGISLSTLATWVGKKDDIKTGFQEFGPKRKSMKSGKWDELETALLKWLSHAREIGATISGAVVLEKANQCAKSLDLTDFEAKLGWLTRFKDRHGISFRSICKESKVVDTTKETVQQLENKIKLGESAENGGKMAARGPARKPQGRSTMSPIKQASATGIDPAMRLQKTPGRPATEGSSHRIPKDRRELTSTSQEEMPTLAETQQETDTVALVESLNDKEGFDRDLMSLEKFREQQKAIEEANKQKKALLAKTISERKKAAQAETHKLEHIQRELSRLDQLLTNDVQVIRNKIEDVSRDYLEAEKRFQRAEAEYVAAKVDLHQKCELKEQLTEHMYTIIHQNEVRKARKLTELAREMEVTGGVTVGDEDLALPELPPLSSFQQTSLSPTGLKQHVINLQISVEGDKTGSGAVSESTVGEKTSNGAATSKSTTENSSNIATTSGSTTVVVDPNVVATLLEKEDGTVETREARPATNVVGSGDRTSESTTDNMTLVMECSGVEETVEPSQTNAVTANRAFTKPVIINTHAKDIESQKSNHPVLTENMDVSNPCSVVKLETEDESGQVTIVKIEPGEIDTTPKVPSKWDFDGNVS